MSALLVYIEEQQDAVGRVCSVLEALEALEFHNADQNTRSNLLSVGIELARTVALNLDRVNLPEGGEA